MTVQRAKIALNSARFPLVSTKGSRAVFIPGADSAPRTPRQFMGTEDSADYNMPQVLYMENMMPVAEGYRSAAIQQSIAPHTLTPEFDQAFTIRDSQERTVLYVPAGGKNYVYNTITWRWVALPCAAYIFPGISANWTTAPVTVATVSGQTLVCYGRAKPTSGTSKVSLLRWDEAGYTLINGSTSVDNLPFDLDELDGIAASSGYLIAWSGLEVAWGTYDLTTNKFNFAPYASGEFTGNGVQIPEDLKGPVQHVSAVPGGFIIFTTRNAVAATYNAANTVSPWAFREVSGAGGIQGGEQASSASVLGSLFAYTSSGMQRISLNSAEAVHPQISDFIAGRTIERYSAGELTQDQFSADLRTKVTIIGHRYLVVSYGAPTLSSFEYALIFDFALQRLGKVKVSHVDAFELPFGNASTSLTYADAGAASYTYSTFAAIPYDSAKLKTPQIDYAPHCISFLKNTGEVVTANWSYDARVAADAGVLLIGRIQLSRSRHTEINRIELEGAEACQIQVVPSYNGATLEAPVTLTTVESVLGYLCAGGTVGCKNFNILITGTFAATTLIIEAQQSGQI